MNTQNGNAIIWIFIAVGLFAALGFTFMKSSRTSTTVITDAQAQAYANEIIAYGNEVKQAIKRMRLRGVDITEIDFSDPSLKLYTDPTTTWATNPLCLSDKCKVINANGGQITVKTFEDIATPHLITTSTERPQAGHPRLYRTNVLDVGTVANDLTLIINQIPLEICKKINVALGVNSDLTIAEAFGSKGNFDHQNIDNPIVTGSDTILGNDDTAYVGKNAGCFFETPQLRYQFYMVMEAR